MSVNGFVYARQGCTTARNMALMGKRTYVKSNVAYMFMYNVTKY